MNKYRIIKKVSFELQDKTKGTAFTVAHKGRAINVSTLAFGAEDIQEEDNHITVKGDVVLVKAPYINSLGQEMQGLKLMPKMDLEIEG